MTRPTSDPSWATDANYPAGTDPWSAQPTRSTPSSGKRGTGYVPDTDDAAEEDNDVIGSHGDWINYFDSILNGSNLMLNDDFMGTTYTQNWAATNGTVAEIDDSAAGAFGAVKLSFAGSGTAYLHTETLPFVTKDFLFEVSVRAAVLSTGNLLFGNSGLAFLVNGSGTGNWIVYVDAVQTDTGVPITADYMTLRIWRSGTTVKFYIDGVPVQTEVAYVTSITSVLALTVNAANTTDVRIDYAKLWVNR